MKKALFLLPVIGLMFAAAPMIPGLTNPAFADQTHAGKWHGGMNKLNLTDDQKAQIKQIRESASQQMNAIFTSEQKTQLEQARQQHHRVKLNLTDDQKAQLKAIHESTESQINAVLTPTQQQQLQQMRNDRQQHHQEHES